MSTPSKRKCLTLTEKVDVIKKLDSGKSCRGVASELGIGKTQVQTILKRKSDILDEYEQNGNNSSKKAKASCSYSEIDTLCHDWFTNATNRHINVTGPLLQERALKFASDLDLHSFKASNVLLYLYTCTYNDVHL